MKKEELIVILLSTAVIAVPSALSTLIAYLIWGNVWIALAGSLCVFWLIGQLSNMYFQQRGLVDIEKVKLQELAILGEQSIEVSCSYCKVRNIVPVRLNGRNEFSCTGCKQTNLIIFQFATAQITTPLQEPQLGSQNGPNIDPTPTSN